MSGAGRSDAADVLEDLGFFVIDNLPPALIPKVAELGRGRERPRRYALVVDVALGRVPRRPRGRARRAARDGRRDPGPVPRRGRRRARPPVRGHPPPPPARATRDRVIEGIAARARAARGAEGRGRPRRRHVRPQRARAARPAARALRRAADVHERPADQHRVVRLQARPPARRRPRLRLPLPPEPALGRGAAPARRAPTPRCGGTCWSSTRRRRSSSELERLFALLLPAYVREGKSYLSIGVGCTGGRHRSVVIAEELGRAARAASASAPASTTGTSTVTDARRAAVRRSGRRRARRRARPRGRARARRAGTPGRSPRSSASPTTAARPAGSGATSACPRRATCASASSRWPATTPCGARRSSTASAAASSTGHALGNLVIVGLAETLGDFSRRARRGGPAARRGRAGCSRPRPTPVVLKADVEGEAGRGPGGGAEQRRAGSAGSSSSRATPPRPPDALAAIARADQVVLAPGSLYTSLLPVLCVPEPAGGARRGARAGSSRSATCGPQVPETEASTPPTTCGRSSSTAPGSTRFLYQTRRARSRPTRPRSGSLGVEPVGGRGGPDRRAGPRSGETGDGPAGSAVVRPAATSR